MNELWASFITSFCKVSIVCWQGEPNWLGWIVIAAAFGIVIALASLTRN